MSELTPEQQTLRHAAILYSFERGASPKALATVYNVPENEVIELIRTAIANLSKSAVEAEERGRQAERQSTNLFLSVVRERLDCLKEHGLVEQCDALETLELNLDGAIEGRG